AAHLGDGLLERSISAHEPRAREAVLEIAHKRIRIVAQQNSAHALRALGHQNGSERAFADGEVNLRIGTAGTVVRRRHAQQCAGGLGAERSCASWRKPSSPSMASPIQRASTTSVWSFVVGTLKIFGWSPVRARPCPHPARQAYHAQGMGSIRLLRSNF